MTRHAVFRVFFPVKRRFLPFQRELNITLRSIHILCFSVLVGGHFFQQPVDQLTPWLWATVGSGCLMIVIELSGSFSFLIEVRGISVVVKTLLLALVPYFWEERLWMFVAIIFIASVTSHMRGKYRHLSVISEERLNRWRGLPSVVDG